MIEFGNAKTEEFIQKSGDIKQYIKKYRLTKRSSLPEITKENKPNYDFQSLKTLSDGATAMETFSNNDFLFIFDEKNLQYLTKGKNVRCHLDETGPDQQYFF